MFCHDAILIGPHPNVPQTPSQAMAAQQYQQLVEQLAQQQEQQEQRQQHPCVLPVSFLLFSRLLTLALD
jgi:hypothetical protein